MKFDADSGIEGPFKNLIYALFLVRSYVLDGEKSYLNSKFGYIIFDLSLC